MLTEMNLTFDFPDWAVYSAIDENGDFCVFDEKPFVVESVVGEGIYETKSNFMLLAKNCVVDDWKKSLNKI